MTRTLYNCSFVVLLRPTIHTLDDRQSFDISALLDSGATGCYIEEGFAQAKALNLESLPCAIPVYNADGSLNEGGPIRHVVNLCLQIDDHDEVFPFAVMKTGKSDIIIGFEWLRKHNPTIDWWSGSISFDRCPPTCSYHPLDPDIGDGQRPIAAVMRKHLEEGDCLWVTTMHEKTADERASREAVESIGRNCMSQQCLQRKAEEVLKNGS